jgi:hypothetical protein
VDQNHRDKSKNACSVERLGSIFLQTLSAINLPAGFRLLAKSLSTCRKNGNPPLCAPRGSADLFFRNASPLLHQIHEAYRQSSWRSVLRPSRTSALITATPFSGDFARPFDRLYVLNSRIEMLMWSTPVFMILEKAA